MADQSLGNGQFTTSVDTKKRQIGRVILSTIVVVGLLIGGVVWQRQRSGSARLEVGNRQSETGENSGTVSNTSTYSRVIDQDMDGVTDTDEEALGTSGSAFDTDNDGLSDVDEVVWWKTNPTVADSDGDGYADGVEVGRGYNPKGSGRF